MEITDILRNIQSNGWSGGKVSKLVRRIDETGNAYTIHTNLTHISASRLARSNWRYILRHA